MDNLLVSALHSAATDSIAQPQILVIAHAPGILTVVADERLQTLAQFRGFRPQAFQGGDHLLHLAGPQVFGNLMNPAVGLCGILSETQTGKGPSVFQGMPKIEDFATVHKHRGAVPDPFGGVPSGSAYDHDDGVVRVQPTQFPQLSVQAPKDLVGFSQAGDQKSSHHRPVPGRSFDSFAGRQQYAGVDLAEMALFDNRQSGQSCSACPPAAVSAHLHSQRATVDSQDHRRRSMIYRSTFTAAVGVILAQSLAVAGRRPPQSLHHPPPTHGADRDRGVTEPTVTPVRREPLRPAVPTDEPKSRKCVPVPRPEDPTRVDVPVCSASNGTVPQRPEAAPSAPARKPDAYRDKSWAGRMVDTPVP